MHVPTERIIYFWLKFKNTGLLAIVSGLPDQRNIIRHKNAINQCRKLCQEFKKHVADPCNFFAGVYMHRN